MIRSVDVNYHLADNPLISSSLSFYTQNEMSQKCLMVICYLVFNTCSSFPHRLVTFGWITQTALSLTPECVVDKEQEQWRPAAWQWVS